MKFKQRLETHTGRFSCITQEIFQKVVSYHQNQALEQLHACIEKINDPIKDKDEFAAALFGYIIHYKKDEDILHSIKRLYENKPDYFDVEISKARTTFIQDFETLRIVDDLIISKQAKENEKMQGKMKILRVSYIKNGNRLYTTLCIARQIASKNKHFMFELIRDFGNFRLRDINKDLKNCENALFRVRRVLQTEHCQFTDPHTFKPCELNCKQYTPQCPGLTCENCNHVHKQINLYSDLKHLPVLLILQRRGRLGDTFPASFNCMDLRICYRDHVSIFYMD